MDPDKLSHGDGEPAVYLGVRASGIVIGVSAFDASYATAASLPISLLPYLTHAVGAILLLIAGTLDLRAFWRVLF